MFLKPVLKSSVSSKKGLPLCNTPGDVAVLATPLRYRDTKGLFLPATPALRTNNNQSNLLRAGARKECPPVFRAALVQTGLRPPPISFRKARQATFERIVENAPATLTA